MADDAGDEDFSGGQFHVAPDFEFMFVTDVACFDQVRLGVLTRSMTSTMSRSGKSVVCGPCQLSQQIWRAKGDRLLLCSKLRSPGTPQRKHRSKPGLPQGDPFNTSDVLSQIVAPDRSKRWAFCASMLHRSHLNGTGGPISGVFNGPAAPTTITTALPPGFLNGSASSFQLFISQMFPDGSI